MWLRVEALRKEFPLGAGLFSKPGSLHALRGVSFHLEKGETLAIVGESGCGKSTLARCLVGLMPVTGGRAWLGDDELFGRTAGEWLPLRRKIQMVFQDPFSSLNPRLTISEVLEEPMLLTGSQPDETSRTAKIRELLDTVGLAKTVGPRFPHELSGGQRQRVGIARALAVGPELLICDEPVSALDVSIQAQILNLFLRLQKDLGLSLIFITHDLRVAGLVSHRVAVFYLGEIVEEGNTREVFANPRHPYTKSLLSSVPRGIHGNLNLPAVKPLEGEPPSPVNLPPGCAFYSRCPDREERCLTRNPALKPIAETHRVACWPVTD